METEKYSLREKTLAGLGWTTGAHVGKQALQFGVSIALARLLTPQDFGLVAMIAVFIGFAALFGDLGFSAALIQREKVEERHYSSVFWLNLTAAVVLTGLLMAAAPFIASFYDEPRLAPLTRFIAVIFFIASLYAVQNAILSREMNFRLLAFIEIISVAGSGGIAIVLALTGHGVWSLVWQMLIASSISVSTLWALSDWRPRLLFDRSAVIELWRYGGNLLGFTVANYWMRRGDDLLVGKFLGTSALGIYTRAYDLMLLPLNQVSGVVSRVMFPALSRIQEDKARVKDIYLRTVGMIAVVTFPMMMGLLVVAEAFILAVFGTKWGEVTRILQILCVVGMAQSVTSTHGWIYQSQGRTDWMFRWAIFAGPVVLTGFAIGISIGTIEAVAWSYVISTGLLTYWSFSIPGKLIGMGFGDVVRSVEGCFGCALAMAVAVWVLGLLLPARWPHWAYLAVQVPFGIIAYGILVHLIDLKAYREIRELLRQDVHPRFRASMAARRLETMAKS